MYAQYVATSMSLRPVIPRTVSLQEPPLLTCPRIGCVRYAGLAKTSLNPNHNPQEEQIFLTKPPSPVSLKGRCVLNCLITTADQVGFVDFPLTDLINCCIQQSSFVPPAMSASASSLQHSNHHDRRYFGVCCHLSQLISCRIPHKIIVFF